MILNFNLDQKNDFLLIILRRNPTQSLSLNKDTKPSFTLLPFWKTLQILLIVLIAIIPLYLIFLNVNFLKDVYIFQEVARGGEVGWQEIIHIGIVNQIPTVYVAVSKLKHRRGQWFH